VRRKHRDVSANFHDIIKKIDSLIPSTTAVNFTNTFIQENIVELINYYDYVDNKEPFHFLYFGFCLYMLTLV